MFVCFFGSAKRRSTAPKTAPSAGEAERAQASEPSNTAPSAEETKGAQASELPSTPPSAGETEKAQASEPPNTAPSAGEAEGVQASEHPNTATSAGEAERAQASESPNSAPSAGEAEGVQASDPPSELETNNVSSSSGQDTVLASPSGQEDEKDQDGSTEQSTEKQIGGLELSQGEERNEIQLRELSLGDSDKNEGEDNSSRLKSDMRSVAGTSSESLNDDPVMEARRTSDSSSDAFQKLEA